MKTMIGRSALLDLLRGLLSLPTAPFHERFVSAFLQAELEKSRIDYRLDRFGNIIAEYGNKNSPVAWVAHMDHPGFEIAQASKDKAVADWFGGVAAKYFVGSRVVIYDQSSGAVRSRGVVKGITRTAQGRVEKMRLRIRGSAVPGDFGAWDLVPFRRRGDFIDTKGADDLVGCALMLCALRELKKLRLKQRVRACFTRAEEQGFLGTLGMIRGRVLSPTTKVIS
ncbi:MAG: M28 family peptidase, partial [Candidatus Binatia bacterium]